jgi:hypothetical protein
MMTALRLSPHMPGLFTTLVPDAGLPAPVQAFVTAVVAAYESADLAGELAAVWEVTEDEPPSRAAIAVYRVTMAGALREALQRASAAQIAATTALADAGEAALFCNREPWPDVAHVAYRTASRELAAITRACVAWSLTPAMAPALSPLRQVVNAAAQPAEAGSLSPETL